MEGNDRYFMMPDVAQARIIYTLYNNVRSKTSLELHNFPVTLSSVEYPLHFSPKMICFKPLTAQDSNAKVLIARDETLISEKASAFTDVKIKHLPL